MTLNKNICAVILGFALISFTACDDDTNTDGCKSTTVYPRTYVAAYQTEITAFDVEIKQDKVIYLFEETSLMYGYFPFSSYGDDEVFEMFSEKHGDHDFQGKMMLHSGDLYKCHFFAMDFVDVEIISDADYNTDHPAGTSLSDMVRFKTVTPFPFVKSRYIDTYDWGSSSLIEEFQGHFTETLEEYADEILPWHVVLGRQNVFPVNKLASDLVKDDLTLLGRGKVWAYSRGYSCDPFAVLEFEREPESEKSHNIVITMTDDQGREHKTEPFRMEWR